MIAPYTWLKQKVSRNSKGYDPDRTNAFAHAYVSTKFTADYGWATAYALSQRREEKTFIGNVIDNNHKYGWGTYRDLWNNKFGRKAGKLYNDEKMTNIYFH